MPVVSRYIRLTVCDTMEVQIFDGDRKGRVAVKKWMQKLNETFGRKMGCEVVVVTERKIQIVP